jgi:AmmeMemoRadiSam system protein A
MYFIDQYYCDYDIVHITPGFTGLEENYHIGKLIQNVIHKSNSKILILCSGDLSHALSDKGPYSYHRNGKIFDDHIKMSIESKDVLKLLYLDHRIIEEASQCGLRSFLIGFGSMDGYYYESEVLSYEGPCGVGYLTGFLNKSEEENSSLLFALQKNKEKIYFNKIQQEDEYILLARKSIETYIKTGKKISLDYVGKHFSKDFIDKCMQHHLGAFVSIHKNHMLRGCMGTISAATDHLLDEIIYNSISACSNDPRFDRVREEELVELDIKVDLLYEKEEIFSKDDLDTMKYGVIVEKDSKRGLLLPNLEGIDSVEEQIKIAMEKAGIKNKEGMLLYRFEVERHEVQ